MTPEVIITTLMPFIIFGVAEFIKLVSPYIKGVYLLLLTTTSSAVLALVASITIAPEASWITVFAVGMFSTIVHQFYKQYQSGN